MTGRRREAGFTLVEALVGLAILSGVLIATYSALSNALAIAWRVTARREAVAAVEAQLESLRSNGLAQAEIYKGSTQAYRWKISAQLLPVRTGQNLRPVRVTGYLFTRGSAPASEVVVDTVILARPK